MACSNFFIESRVADKTEKCEIFFPQGCSAQKIKAVDSKEGEKTLKKEVSINPEPECCTFTLYCSRWFLITRDTVYMSPHAAKSACEAAAF